MERGPFEREVHELLCRSGFYYNDGYRRDADARAAGAMPPPLSAGEAADEVIGNERARTLEVEHGAGSASCPGR